MASQKKAKAFVAIPLEPREEPGAEASDRCKEKPSPWSFALRFALFYGKPPSSDRYEEESTGGEK